MASELAWMSKAQCHGIDDRHIFFPGEGDRAAVNRARKICFRCPVRQECLNFCLARGVQGIWGGTTDYERLQMRRVSA
jgi:WhiB family redox-sensing transcriptional regulator